MHAVRTRSERTIDIASAVPLLVGVAGSPADTAPPVAELAATVAGLLREFTARCPHTPLAVIHNGATGAAAAVVDAARAAGVPVLERDASAEAIADASDLLLVASYGDVPGDLAALAERRRSGAPPAAGRKRLAPPDTGPCLLLAGATLTRTFPARYTGDLAGETEFAQALARRDRFNADLLTAPPPGTGTTLERLRARLSAVTNELQAKTVFWQRALYAIAFLAASVQVITVIPHGAYLKFAAVAVAFACFFFVRRQAYQSRYQDYRAVSEALRVQAVWSALGIEENVAEGYLPMQQTDLQWVRNLLRTIGTLAPAATPSGGYDAVLAWVSEQHRYFAARSHEEGRKRDRFGRLTSVLGALSAVASLAILGASIAHSPLLATPYAAAAGILAAWAALCVAVGQSYARTRGYAENANRYQRMFFVVDRALAVLRSAPGDEATAREVATELGRLALAEHAEWLLGQRERPIAMVQTGAA